MDVIVSEILHKNPFTYDNLIAGSKGLNNTVKYVSVLETEPEQNNEVFLRTEVLYITSLYYQKDDVEALLNYFQQLFSLKAAGVCVIDDYIQDFPKEVIDFCNNHSLPLILVNHNIPYADIISSVMELIILSQQERLLESRIKILESGNLTVLEKRQIIQDLNPYFKPNITAFFIKSSVDKAFLTSTINTFNGKASFFACTYKRGVLIIFSHAEQSPLRYEKNIKDILREIEIYIPDAIIGISNPCPLDDCGAAISQALTCLKIYANETAKKNIYYDDLGLFKLLAAFLGSKELNTFYNETLQLLIEYDEIHNANIFQTIECFLKHSCNFSATARELSIHENTIRYRIERTKEILKFRGSDMELFHTLNIAYKIYVLKSNLQ